MNLQEFDRAIGQNISQVIDSGNSPLLVIGLLECHKADIMRFIKEAPKAKQNGAIVPVKPSDIPKRN